MLGWENGAANIPSIYTSTRYTLVNWKMVDVQRWAFSFRLKVNEEQNGGHLRGHIIYFNVPSTCAEALFCRVLTSAAQLSSAGQQSGAGGGAVNISVPSSEVKSCGSDNQTCKRCLTMFGMEGTNNGEGYYYLNHPAVKALWTSVTCHNIRSRQLV